MRPRRERYPEVARFVLVTLRFASKPLTRDQIAALVWEQATSTWGYDWTRETAGRRVREAFKALRRPRPDGSRYPVVSEGRGFKLASTEAERLRAAERLRKMARNLFAEADQIESAPIPGEPANGELFPVAP